MASDKSVGLGLNQLCVDTVPRSITVHCFVSRCC